MSILLNSLKMKLSALAATVLLIGATATPAQAAKQWWITEGSGQIESDHVMLWTNGVAKTSVVGGARLAISAKADLCKGVPKIDVLIDDKYVTSFDVTNEKDPKTYYINTYRPYGNHTVSLHYVNDNVGENPGCDRNVYFYAMEDDGDYTNPFQMAPPALNSGYAGRAAAAGASIPNTGDQLMVRGMGNIPTTVWLGDWTPRGQVGTTVRTVIDEAKSRNETPTFAIYGMRGCYGEAKRSMKANEYRLWIKEIVDAMGKDRAVVILEPDALGFSSKCKNNIPGLKETVGVLADKASTVTTYVDAGHSHWLPKEEAVMKLRDVGAERVRGFSLNVSNTQSTDDQIEYGDWMAQGLGRHYVIDTSRNGGSNTMDTCNPSGVTFGQTPKAVMDSKLDAYLWVKAQGESDGICAGSPAEGEFWPQYAVDMTNNASTAMRTRLLWSALGSLGWDANHAR